MRITDAAKQAAFTFLEGQTAHIEREVYETIYPEIQYPDLIPVDTSANPFARSVTYYSSDKFGKARWINGNSDDVPLAGTERAQSETLVHMAGVGYGFGYVELNQAMLAGVNLQNDDAMAARFASEEFIDRVAMFGDAEKGMQGLTNHSAVTPENATTGSWETATEDQMLADVNAALLGVSTATRYSVAADTLLLPHTSMNLIGTRRLSGTAISVRKFLQEENTYSIQSGGRPLTIRGVRGLETAGVGGVKRMVAYRRSPDVLKLHVPMPHQFLPLEKDGPLNWVAPGVFRLGGLDIRRPKEVAYVDGI